MRIYFLQTLNRLCPGSLKVTLRALKIGSRLNLKECLKMEYRLAYRAIEKHDFSEGKLLNNNRNFSLLKTILGSIFFRSPSCPG